MRNGSTGGLNWPHTRSIFPSVVHIQDLNAQAPVVDQVARSGFDLPSNSSDIFPRQLRSHGSAARGGRPRVISGLPDIISCAGKDADGPGVAIQ